MPDHFYFGTRPAAPQTPVDSPYRLFLVQCIHCQSYRVRLVTFHEEDADGISIAMVCQKCRRQEKIDLR